MKRLNRTRAGVIGTAILSSSLLGACGGGGGGNDGGPPITVTISADAATVQPGATAQVTATVSNDKHNGGVRWTVSCSTAPCGTVSPDTTASGAATTFQAPDGHPAGDVPVTVKATAVSDSAVSASTTVTVAGGIAITELDSDPPTVLAGASIQMRVMLVNDTSDQGVTWSVSCAISSCGSISPTSSTSGAYVTYTAPAEMPEADLHVTVTATAVAKSSVQATEDITIPALAVAVTPRQKLVPAGTSFKLKATINYPDPAAQGVSWTIQCSLTDCGSISPTTSASGAQVTYKGPASTPLTELEVTLIASSASAPAVSGSATVTVPPVAIGVTPNSALIPLHATQRFVGNVQYDVPTSDVTWSVALDGVPCSVTCGSVAPTTVADGAATTYTAPDAIPGTPEITLVATSATNAAKSASAVVTLTNGTVKLVPNRLSLAKGTPSATATLTNVGTSDLTINSITITGNTGGLSQSNDCGTSVAAGASCDITVSHSRYALLANTVVSISDSSPDSPQQLHVTAAGPRVPLTASMRQALESRSLVAAPAPMGASKVGTRVLDLVDPTRTDPYSDHHRNRELPVRLWYPMTADAECMPAPYAPAQVWSYISKLIRVPLPHVSTHSCLDGPVTGGQHSVVFLEHGFTGTFTDYTFLAEDLASRGYVVVAVDHAGEATAVEFPDGRLEKSVFGSYLTKYTRSDMGALGFAVAVRLDDLRFVLDELGRMGTESGSPFEGRVDMSHVALVGHSLGGLTTLRGLESDERFKAGVLLDGVMPPNFSTRIQQPMLHVVAGRDRWNQDDCLLWGSLRGKRRAIELPSVEHLALSDAAWLLEGGISTGGRGAGDTIAAIRQEVANFLDTNLRGKDSEAGKPMGGISNAVIAGQADSLCAE